MTIGKVATPATSSLGMSNHDDDRPDLSAQNAALLPTIIPGGSRILAWPPQARQRPATKNAED